MVKRMLLLLTIVSYDLNVMAFSEDLLKNTFKLYYQLKEMLQIKKPAYASLLNASQQKQQSNATKEDIQALSWAAGQEDDQDKVAQLLDKGIDVNAVNEFGHTPIQAAVIHKNEKMVEYLIKKSADVNKKNKLGYAPLMTAVSESGYCFNDKRDQTEIDTCRNTMLRIARMILKENADINTKTNDDSFTPLNLAIQNHDAKMVQLLLENGADMNIKNNDGHTPLSIAVRNHDAEMVELLLEHEADMYIKSNEFNALDTAIVHFQLDNPYCVKILRSLINKDANIINQKNGFFELPLGAISKKFLEYDYKNNTPVDLGIVDFFIEKGADVNAHDKWGYSALDDACRSFVVNKTEMLSANKAVFLEVAKTLLKAGVDCNYNNGEYRNLLLYWTTKEKDIESVARLIENGANVNWNHTATTSGTTRPLHDACVAKDSKIVDMLLEAGADINAKDNNGKTIFDYAQTDTEINMVLQKHLEKIKNLSQNIGDKIFIYNDF